MTPAAKCRMVIIDHHSRSEILRMMSVSSRSVFVYNVPIQRLAAAAAGTE